MYLEDEAIEIIREVAATARNPVMMYSIGKDSSVLLHLAIKAFYPGPVPFPVLHIDTGWKFKEMYEFREYVAKKNKLNLIVYQNPRGKSENIGPFTHGSEFHTDVMKTQALKEALDLHGFDMVIGGARRDEEKSRAKERIFSFRDKHRWNPKEQRPELWNIYNTHCKVNQSIRVFPISNWTELDIWQYIYKEKIEIVPLYFAKNRPVVAINNQLIMVDDAARLPKNLSHLVQTKSIRFRTLGCWPLTAGTESHAQTLEEVISETMISTTSERFGRLIDSDKPGSMEAKKQEGYF